MKLYEITKQKNWSTTIRTRRLKWLGHAIRLPDNTPAKQALSESMRKTKKYRGGQKYTWLKTVEQDLNKIELNMTSALEIAQDRDPWRRTVFKSMNAPSAYAPRA